MTNNNNPWAGLASYEDPSKSERKLKFCGRDNDIYDVTRLIDDNLLLILYGKSGIGKTSLLNAGVFPKLRLEQYLPVSIRLGTLEADASYQEAIISAVENAIEEVRGSITAFNVVEEQIDNQEPDRLWNYFARHRFANAEQQPVFPVVVLDQFEEVLRNISPEHVGKAQTLLNQLQYLIDESHTISDCIVDGKEYFYDFNFRFVISIREDELYLLEDNIDDLSLSMFRNCRYRLRSLSEQGAKEAILVPGKDCIAEEEKQAVISRVIELSKCPQSNDIDTFLLSLVCAGTFDKKAGNKITLSDLAVWKSNPMEVYYQDAIKGLSANQVRYIQQHLIREDGSRKRVDAEEVKTALGESTYHALTRGENRMLVLGEHGQVELLHDQLALAVFEERKAFEDRERKKRLRRRMSLAGLAIFVIGGIFLIQYQRLKEQRTRLVKSQWKLMENQARFVAEKASNLVDEGDSYLAQRLLLNVLPNDVNHPIDRPYIVETEAAFRNATNHNTAILCGHTRSVNSAAFSPDGKLIASASDDNTIRIWDVNTGKELKILKGHIYCICSVEFSNNGKHIVSASYDGTVRIWDTETGKEVDFLSGFDCIRYATFCHNERRIILALCDGTIRVLDAKTRLQTKSIKGHSAALSPDGNRIVSASEDGTIQIWDAKSGKKLLVLEGHTSGVNSVAFSHDGKRIVSTSRDLRIWDSETGVQQLILKGSTPLDYYSATFSPDGRSIVSTSSDYIIRVWDIETGMQLNLLEGHTDFVNSAVFSPNGKQIVSASGDKTVRIWDINNGIEKNHYGEIFSHDGKCIVSVSDDNILIWDIETGKELTIMKRHPYPVLFVAFSPNGKRIILSFENATVGIWDIETSKDLEIPIEHLVNINSAAFSSDGKHIVVASPYEIQLWDIELKTKLDILEGSVQIVHSVAFSPDGKRIVSALRDNTIRIWDAETGNELDILEGHSEWANSAAFSPDGKRIVSASDDKTVRIWDVETGKELKVLEGHTDHVNSAAYSSDGTRIVSASDDKTVRIWDAETGIALQTLKGHTRKVCSAAFSPDGSRIVSASKDGTFHIWDFPSLQELIDQTRERFKDRPLTAEERKMYYLE